ncbi:hypothetical protein [Embleya sp. NBC_00896]|uniref:hypothetical protein n=1 Tax=Embleya sp. NBC_00896 TaxID=2975961 RepID=UPI00386E2C8E|nr:hypothetical protein OG928_20965 [Embleya sp. NBC_00896]
MGHRVHNAARVGRSRGAALALIAVLLLGFVALGGTAPARAADPPPGANPSASIDPGKAAVGDKVSVVGGDWTPGSLVQASICGENGLRGTVNCAAASAASGTVDAGGNVAITLTAVVPPSPCPCVVRIAVVMNGPAKDASVPLEIDGAPFAPLPQLVKTPGRLVFIDSAMVGEDTIFTWFGSPVQRRFRIEVGNMGQTAIINPTFRIGFYEGVYAPTWEDFESHITIAPGQRTTVSLPVELDARQHGTFSWRVMYDGQIVDEQALEVGRPWGVYIFGALLVIVVPVAIWRLFLRIVELIGEQRARRTSEREREVGLPETSSLTGRPMRNRTPVEDTADDGASAAKTANRRPPAAPDAPAEPGEPVDLSKRPIRSIVETVVIGGPLYADAEPAEGGRPRPDESGGRDR